MNDSDFSSLESPSAARQIDQACDRFEAALRAAGLTPAVAWPDPAEALNGFSEPERSALLQQILLLDWEYRRRAGEAPSTADYRGRFPADTAVVEAVAREMSDAADSTQSEGPHTPWTGDDPADREREPPPGSVGAFGRYELLGEVGHGGIGVVYRGSDPLLGRTLAIKMLAVAYRDRPDARRRFLAEARVGSQLQHPAIVPVYELGQCDDGRPFLAMKLVEGHTLAELLRDRPRGAGATAPADLPRLLVVFEQVCQAIAYAHGRGVVHRDLKPANVMVGAFGEVQVMDWGFAKTLGNDSCEPEAPARILAGDSSRPSDTRSGSLMGTPAYMSPEQARGETSLVDRRADVFALGAILCEILTGRPPYAGGPTDDTCRRAAAGDLADAHARLDASPADPALQNLAKRCLAAHAADRPADAAVVAREVTAYQASAQDRLRQAQLARASAEARAAAERRGRRLALGLAAALLVGVGVAAWQAVVAIGAKHDAFAAAATAKDAKDIADAKEAETRAALDFVENQILGAARPKGQMGGLGTTVSLRQALDAALPVVGQSFADQPLTEARLRNALATSYYYLGDAKTSADQYARAHAIYRNRLGPDHRDTLASMSNLANSYDALGRYEDALNLREKALAIQITKLGPDDRATLNTMNNLGHSYDALGRYEDALKIRERTLAGRKAKLGSNHEETIAAMQNLVIAYAKCKRHEDALKLCRETLDLQKAKLPPGHPDTIGSMINLANCYDDLHRYEDALKLREETLPLLKDALPADHPNVFWGMHNLANSYAKIGRPAEALKLHEETLALRETKLGHNHPDTLRSMKMVAENLIKLDRGAEAVPVIDDCLRRSAGQVVHPKLIPDIMDWRLRYFEKANDPAGCGATAELWEQQKRTDAASLYRAAVCRAVTAKVIGATAPSAAAAQADRAMAWLKLALAAGYKGMTRPEADPDLAVLRDRADFQTLVAGPKVRR